jgi:DNA-binding CsgD family transcriptional regulator
MKVYARLRVQSGGDRLLLMPLGEYRIGRHSDCDLIIPSRDVSRHHATIQLDETSAIVIDQESRNGTRIDGQVTARGELQHGSILQLGTTLCLFEWMEKNWTNDDETTSPAYQISPFSRELTAAQQRVLNCLLSGFSEKVIAQKLELSQHTIHNHVKKIYVAYGVNSRPELLSFFINARRLEL